MDKNQCQKDPGLESGANRGISLETIQFSLQILKTLPQNESNNVAFSPVSMYSLLAVLQQGSSGSSRNEMNKVLHTTGKTTGDAVKNLTGNIENSDSFPSLKFMWKSRRKSNSDFAQESQQQEEQSTQNKIPCRISKTFATLANMLCLNGFWAQEGSSKSELDFCPSPGEQFQTEGIQMKKSCFCGISEEIEAKWIHIPIAVQKRSNDTGQCVGVRPNSKSYWSRRKMSFMIMLPTERHGLDKLMQNLTSEYLMKCFDYSPKDDRKNLELTLPAFHINSSIDLKPILKKMGLESVFSNKSGLADVSAEQRLFLPHVMQKGQIVVDQFGARTTQLSETNFPCLFCEPWEETEHCIVDEPFLFFIVDKETLLPLIAGKVTRPEPLSWEPLSDHDDDNEDDDDFCQCQQ